MGRFARLSRAVAAAVLVVLVVASVAQAHDVLYLGTVQTVEQERLLVTIVDEQTKEEQDIWFAVTSDTRVRRGDGVVSYADAGITTGERIVVVVNHDAEIENVATELRLAAR